MSLPLPHLAQNAYVFERLYPLKKTSDPHPNARRQDLLLRHLPEDLAMTYKVAEEEQPPEPVKVILLKNTEGTRACVHLVFSVLVSQKLGKNAFFLRFR